MRLFSILVTFSLLVGSVSAECRDKDCMPDSYEFGNYGHVDIYYNSVFEIGTNWFIIIELNKTEEYYDFNFEFDEGLSKEAHLEDMSDNPDDRQVTDSISFSGSIFSEEAFHKSLFVNITDKNDNLEGSFVLKIHINKPPAEDMIYLWGGMSVFWIAIGAYTLFLSKKFRELNDKIGFTDGQKEKN